MNLLDKDFGPKDNDLFGVWAAWLWWGGGRLHRRRGRGGTAAQAGTGTGTGSGFGTAALFASHAAQLVPQLLLVDELPLAGLQLLDAAVLQLPYRTWDEAVDNVDLAAGEPRRFRMPARQFALILEEQVANAGTSTAAMIVAVILLAFHNCELLVNCLECCCRC